MIRRAFSILAGGLALLLSCNVHALPITLAESESATFNFDATALSPYQGIGIEWSISEFDTGVDRILGEGFAGLDGTGGSEFFCVTNDLSFCDAFLPGPHTTPGLLDGVFSFVVTAEIGTFTIDDVVALVYSQTGAVTRLSPVPAPATFALLGLGIAGISYGRRKQIKAA